jgi:unsaturated rhamnogalacturonyl hydrolase
MNNCTDGYIFQDWSKMMADSVIKRGLTYKNKWSYDNGVIFKGFELVWRRTNNDKYLNFIKEHMDSYIDQNGCIEGYTLEDYNLDNINNGKMLIFMYKQTGELKYKKALEQLREQLNYHPRTKEGAFWHKKIYPNQIWLDGLYMGAPFYAEYIKSFGNAEEFSDVTRQYIICESHTKDIKSGLLYHGWDEKKSQNWSDPHTGCSENFWGRSVGWYIMGLVDTLDSIPKEHEDRTKLIKILNEVLEALLKVKDRNSNVWYQVLDKQSIKGNYLEASCSSMIVYTMAKSIRKGYLTDLRWRDELKKSYKGLIEEFITVTKRGLVNLNKTCQVAGLGGGQGRDGSFEYYISEPIICNDGKGVGAFIQASAEVQNLYDI